MCLGNIVDQLHDKHGLADTSTTEQANFASALVGGQEVHHLHLNGPMSDKSNTSHKASGQA